MHHTKSPAQPYKQLQLNYDLMSTNFWDSMPYSPWKSTNISASWDTCSRTGILLSLYNLCGYATILFLLRYVAFLWNDGWLPTGYMLYMLEDGSLHNHHCQSLKSHKLWFLQYSDNYYQAFKYKHVNILLKLPYKWLNFVKAKPEKVKTLVRYGGNRETVMWPKI
jgi:hypothetical protein